MFREYNVTNKFTQIKRSSLYECHNRLVLLSRTAKKLNGEIEEHCYVKLSLYRLIERLLTDELKEKKTNHRYQKLLEREFNSIVKLTKGIPPGKMVGLRDLLGNTSYFGYDAK